MNFQVEYLSNLTFCCYSLLQARNAVQSVKTDIKNPQCLSLCLISELVPGQHYRETGLQHSHSSSLFVMYFTFTLLYDPWDHLLFCSLFIFFIIVGKVGWLLQHSWQTSLRAGIFQQSIQKASRLSTALWVSLSMQTTNRVLIRILGKHPSVRVSCNTLVRDSLVLIWDSQEQQQSVVPLAMFNYSA